MDRTEPEVMTCVDPRELRNTELPFQPVCIERNDRFRCQPLARVRARLKPEPVCVVELPRAAESRSFSEQALFDGAWSATSGPREKSG